MPADMETFIIPKALGKSIIFAIADTVAVSIHMANIETNRVLLWDINERAGGYKEI